MKMKSILNVILFSFISVQVAAPKCERDSLVFDINSDNELEKTIALLDNSPNIGDDAVSLILTHVEYYFLHQLQWIRSDNAMTLGNQWFSDGRMLFRKIKQLAGNVPYSASVPDANIILAIARDMRGLRHAYTDDKSYMFPVVIRETLELFNFPTLFKLEKLNRMFVDKLEGASKVQEIVKSLLPASIPRWFDSLAQNGIDFGENPRTLASEEMDVLSQQEGTMYLHTFLRAQDVDVLPEKVSKLSFFVLQKLREYDAGNPQSAIRQSIDNAIPNARLLFLESFRRVDISQMAKETVRFMLLVARTHGADLKLTVSQILQIRRLMHGWYMEGQSTNMFQPMSIELSLTGSKQYSVKSILHDDMAFLRESLLVEGLSRHRPIFSRPCFHDEQNVVDIYSELSLMDVEVVQTVLRNVYFADLFKLQEIHRLRDQDTQYDMDDIIRQCMKQNFIEWIRSGLYLEYKGPEGAFSDPNRPTHGWKPFGPESEMLFHHRGLDEVARNILEIRNFPKERFRDMLQFVDYLSLVQLKKALLHALELNPHMNLGIGNILGAVDLLLQWRQPFYPKWLRENGASLVQNKMIARRLLTSLQSFSDIPINLHHLLLWQKNVEKWYPARVGDDIVTPEDVVEILDKSFRTFASQDRSDIELALKENMLDIAENFARMQRDDVRRILENLEATYLVALYGASEIHGHADVIDDMLRVDSFMYYPLRFDFLVSLLDKNLATNSAAQKQIVQKIPYLPLFELEKMVLKAAVWVPAGEHHIALTPNRELMNVIDACSKSARGTWISWFRLFNIEQMKPHEMSKLLFSLQIVDHIRRFVTPTRISRLGDMIRKWHPDWASPTGRSTPLVSEYIKAIEWVKQNLQIRLSESHDYVDWAFRTQIWHGFDEDMSIDTVHPPPTVKFSQEIHSSRRQEVHDAIDWAAVSRRIQKGGEIRQYHSAGGQWSPPEALEKYSDKAANKIRGRAGHFKFLVPPWKTTGLPSEWFLNSNPDVYQSEAYLPTQDDSSGEYLPMS